MRAAGATGSGWTLPFPNTTGRSRPEDLSGRPARDRAVQVDGCSPHLVGPVCLLACRGAVVDQDDGAAGAAGALTVRWCRVTPSPGRMFPTLDGPGDRRIQSPGRRHPVGGVAQSCRPARRSNRPSNGNALAGSQPHRGRRARLGPRGLARVWSLPDHGPQPSTPSNRPESPKRYASGRRSKGSRSATVDGSRPRSSTATAPPAAADPPPATPVRHQGRTATRRVNEAGSLAIASASSIGT